LVFLNDESDNVSPEEWNTSLTVISDIVDAFTIGANDVRVGLAAYSGNVVKCNHLVVR
jgi:phosphate/sulfate permease